MIFSINTGLLEACVLALLKDSDSYGYKLTQDVKSLLKYYKITPAGLRQHELYIGEWKSYKELIDKIFKGTAL